ncbi:exodeoxyribonuclease V subunit alpha [Corallincola luteus]|uniref:RecBCD enzyme subunit RecD n=1 Tax=Corallincola luteus TaxID=1775177 RepID=A0ABY2AHF3_9GAMM|nr:exodeoxyribonuclease V subunit alpha [Corallincola luteus]TCI02016.1 exodeoxyribonuclease V subunit alpha [Corallincola luteus]
MSYRNSEQCQQQLADIEAIDYFFAQQMSLELAPQRPELLFHLLLALQWALRQGHSCLPLSQVANKLFWDDREADKKGYLFPSQDRLADCLATISCAPDANKGVVYDAETGLLYIRRYWLFEGEVAAALQSKLQLSPLSGQQQARLTGLLPQLFPVASAASLAEPDWQQVAVANAMGRKLSIISGGPGTGKTYTVTRLLAALQAAHECQLQIQMAAPTGKAAQRLKESIADAKCDMLKQGIDAAIVEAIPEQAATLHRLLGYRPQSLDLKFNREQPLRCDLLLIDEVSMIDLPMMARVLRALPDDATLVLLGDAEQLPSVEVGRVMADLTCAEHPGYSPQAAAQINELCGQQVPTAINANYDHLTLLTQSRRFGGEIGVFAKEVIEADIDATTKRLMDRCVQQISFQHNDANQLSYINAAMVEEWLPLASAHYFLDIARASTLDEAFAALARFRVLVPTRVGDRGVEQLNVRIEQWLAQRNGRIKPEQHYAGRPVMVTQNSYSTGLFNGDVGLIWPMEDGRLAAWFEQEGLGYKRISLARLPQVETVYAMTIHKTQGSEFAHVALLLPEQESPLLTPELLYTGLTRAKQHLYVAGGQHIWRAALAQKSERYSGLAERMQDR